MKLIIDISEEVYKRTLPYKDTPVISNLANDNSELTYAIANGIPLPKGDGAIIDKTLESSSYNEGYARGYRQGYGDGWNECVLEDMEGEER